MKASCVGPWLCRHSLFSGSTCMAASLLEWVCCCWPPPQPPFNGFEPAYPERGRPHPRKHLEPLPERGHSCPPLLKAILPLRRSRRQGRGSSPNRRLLPLLRGRGGRLSRLSLFLPS